MMNPLMNPIIRVEIRKNIEGIKHLIDQQIAEINNLKLKLQTLQQANIKQAAQETHQTAILQGDTAKAQGVLNALMLQPASVSPPVPVYPGNGGDISIPEHIATSRQGIKNYIYSPKFAPSFTH
jgi:hypothetical protein